MKLTLKCIYLVLFILLNGSIVAQSVFSGATGAIPDFPADTCFTLALNNIFPAYIDTTFGLQKVCLNIEHPSPQDLDITLIAPGNSSALISQQNGNDEEWEGVCFTMDAETSITAANNFFDAEFLPEDNLGAFNDGQLAVGLWQLCVTDVVEGNEGMLLNWQLHFNFDAADPVNAELQEICTTNTTYGCNCLDGGDNCFLLPDLTIVEALTLANFKEVTAAIKFNTAISNIGYGPLELYTSNKWYCEDTLLPGLEMCKDGQWPQQLIKQRVYRKFPDKTAGFDDSDAGFMPYQTIQGFNNRPQIVNWVENTIRIRGTDPDPLSWPVIINAYKTALCVDNTILCTESNMVCFSDDSNYHIDNLPNSRLGQNYACNSEKAGIAVGYAQFDSHDAEGQEIQFSATTCNGTYYLVTEFDPDSLITESNEFNNVSAVEIQLTEQVENCCEANFSAEQLVLNGSSIGFKDLSTPIPNNWLWNFGDGQSGNTQFPVIEYDEPGEYTVSLVIENELGCSSEVTKTITVEDLKVSVNEFFHKDIQLTILANDAIQLNLALPKLISVNLLSIDGKFINNIIVNEFLNEGVYTKALPAKQSGVYLLQIKTNEVIGYQKIILF